MGDSLLDIRYFLSLSISFPLFINRKKVSSDHFYIDTCIAFSLDLKNLQDLKEDKKKIKNDERFEQSVCFDIEDSAPLKGKSIICYGCLCFIGLGCW